MPLLRFSPTAWAKLLYLRDAGDTEVGGFGICPSELLLVEDIRLVLQTCSFTTVQFSDDSVADFFDEQVDQGLRPEQFARVWIHTHPGDCPQPSHTDEETFSRVFGQTNWSVMFILACDGSRYSRLRFNEGPTAELMVPIEIDFRQEFPATNFTQWRQEYLANIEIHDAFSPSESVALSIESKDQSPFTELDWYSDAYREMLKLEQQEEQFNHGYH